MLGRRTLMKLGILAPVAATMAKSGALTGGGYLPPVAPAVTESQGMMKTSDTSPTNRLAPAIQNPEVRAIEREIEHIYRSREKRSQAEHQRVVLIDCLRSPSPSTKVRMKFNLQLREEAERNTLHERLMKARGLFNL